MNKVVCWVVITLLIVSCSKEPQNIIPQASVTSINSPVPTNTVFSKPLITPTISSTPRPVSTKTPTLTPNPILLTQEAEILSCAGSEKNWFDKLIWDTYFTNGQWNAYVCKDDGVYTKISNPTDGIVWNIPALDDDQTNLGPEWYWLPYLWSDDGSYLYLTPHCLCIIDSPWLIYLSGYGLSRLNLETGQFDSWLKPSDSGYSFSFTDDGSFLAVSPGEFPAQIKVRNLISGEERNLSFGKTYFVLELDWTPDNSRLVILAQELGGYLMNSSIGMCQ